MISSRPTGVSGRHSRQRGARSPFRTGAAGVVAAAVVLATMLSGPTGPRPAANASGTSISLDEPFTGATLTDPSKWISMRGGSHPEWPCLTAATTSIAASAGTVEACVNQGGTTVAAGDGAMRLSRFRLPAQNWSSAGSLLYTDPFSASEGIDITFSVRLGSGDVADGMSFFLKDGSNPTNTVGVAGGALGYGQFFNRLTDPATSGPGVPGAMFGLGFDRYGNFSSRLVASSGCANRGTHNATTPADPGDKNKLVLRGPDTSVSQDGSAGYCYLKGENVSFSSTDFQRVRVKVNPYASGSPTTVSVFLAATATPTILPLTPTMTETMTFTATSFKFGFSAATGYWSNDHEIRGLTIRPAGPAVSAISTSAATGSGTGPTSGGTTLTITGTNIDPAATVTVDGRSCTSVSVNGGGTELTCLTPAGSLGTKQVVITNPNGGPAFGSFTYVDPPPTTTTTTTAPANPAPAPAATTTTSTTTTSTTTTVPQRRDPVFNELSSRPFPNSAFSLVASTFGEVVRLESQSPSTCAVAGTSVVFVGSGRCEVHVVANGSVVHEFVTLVRSDAPVETPGLAALDNRQVMFSGDSAQIQQSALRTIRRILPALRNARAVIVTGHAADAGDPNGEVAMNLSMRRALAIAAILRARGIEVTVENSFGKTRPISSERALNRRVEIAWYSGGR